MDQELPEFTGVMEPCVRCRAKGIVLCPTCQGTGEKRNESYVVVDWCHDCIANIRGFITCPSCLGKKVVESGQPRRSYRLETERMRSVPSVWGYEDPTLLSSSLLSVTDGQWQRMMALPTSAPPSSIQDEVGLV